MSYSAVCKRCGRKLKSEVSRKRGYGSYCYSRICKDKANDNCIERDNVAEQIDGQLNMIQNSKEIKVRFIDVGRNNETWTANYKERYGGLEDWIIGQARKALASSNVWIAWNNENSQNGGSIYAGFYNVGKFGILEEAI
jgi:hypothetical protein